MQTLELLDNKTEVESFLKQSGESLAVYSFTNLFAWKDYFKFEFKIINDGLCVFAKNEIGCFMYWPPLGKRIIENTIDQCFIHMESINQGNGVSRIENVGQNLLEFFNPTQYRRYKKGYEYCYYKEDIVALRGNRYKSKRGLLNQVRRQGKIEYLPFERKMKEECLALYDQWATQRCETNQDDIYQEMIKENRKGHALTFEYDQQLGLLGRVVKVDGVIKAYSFGYKINSENFCVFSEISDLSIKGLAVYIFHKLCKDKDLKSHKFINAMDDFELKNVAKTKMSFYPTHLLANYSISKYNV